MNGSRRAAVAFDCFGTLLRIMVPTNPWRSLLAEARHQPGARVLDPRSEPIPMIEDFAAACGVEFLPEWRRDLDRELASIEPMPDAVAVLSRLRGAGIRLALASNLAPAYVEPTLRLLGELVDVTCFSCDHRVRAVKPDRVFFDILQTKIGLPAEQILMVGDSLTSDVQGAEAAGMSALHLSSCERLPSPGHINRLADVPGFLGLT